MKKVTTYNLEEEKRIISDAQKNPQAYEVIYNLFYEQVFRFVFRRTDIDALAADITSQVFLKGMLSINKYQFRGISYLAWLYRTATNEINGYYRGQNSNRIVSIDDTDFGTLFPEDGESDLEEKKILIIEFLERLSIEEITILELKFFEERSYKDIAYVLEKKESMVKMKAYRALEKLRKMFGKEGIGV